MFNEHFESMLYDAALKTVIHAISRKMKKFTNNPRQYRFCAPENKYEEKKHTHNELMI